MYRVRLLFIFVISVCGASCTHKEIVPLNVNDPFYAHKNIAYGHDTVQQTMDIYLPKFHPSDNVPVVIVLHGGGWYQGYKAEMNATGIDTFFTSNGFAVVNMNYRLDGKYKFPAPVDDIGLVMDYIKEHAASLGINPSRICMLGISSGAHLALLYAYSRNNYKRIKAVLDFCGPVNFTDSSILFKPFNSFVSAFVGSYSANSQVWHDASPTTFMSGAVPTAIFHGTSDTLVYYRQAQILDDSLRARGVNDMFVTWVGYRHGWNQMKWVEWRWAILDWLSKYI